MAFARAMDALKSVGQNAGLTEQTELYDRGQTITINKHPFRVENIIAKGGFGTVFLATNNKGGPVAVKILLCHDAAAKKDIDNEITMMKNCDHENIVQLYETSAEERDSRRGVKEYKIVMEYCKFSIADVLLKYKEVAVDFVVRIIYFTSRALVFLHQKGITHRDIKAENLLINGKGVLKLCDFGSATAESYDMSALSHNNRISLQEEVYKYTTPITRSPELCDVYSNWPIGKQQDIWAMGCLIYFVCFGEHPFDGSPLAIINGKYKKPPPVSENQLSAFADLMSKCLVPNPSLRITAESIEEYMKLIMTKRPVLAAKKDFADILTHMNEISQAESLAEIVPNKALGNIQDKVYNNYTHFKNLLVQQSSKLGLRPADATDSPRPNEQPSAPVTQPVKPIAAPVKPTEQQQARNYQQVKAEPVQSTWTADFASFESANTSSNGSQNSKTTLTTTKKDLFDPFAEASSHQALSTPRHSEDLLSLQGWPGTVDHVVMKPEMKSQSSKDLFDFDDLVNRHTTPTKLPTALQPTRQVENKNIKKVDNNQSKNGIGPSSSSASLDDMVSQMMRLSTPQSNNK